MTGTRKADRAALERQKGLIYNILNMALEDLDHLGPYLDHIGFDIAAIRHPGDLHVAFLGHYRIRPGVYDVERAHQDLLNYPRLPGASGNSGRNGREFSQLICERARKADIRRLGRHLPGTVLIRRVRVKVVSTPCHLGGKRYWFLCPRCGRRCAILYPFWCRTCMRGRYLSELGSPRDRKLLKAMRLRERLGQVSGGIIAPLPPKPHRMHWSTWLRLRDRLIRLEAGIWAAERERKL